MYGGGREKKTKRETKRSKQAAAATAEAEADDGAAQSGNKRDKWLKKDSVTDHGSRRSAAWQPPQGEVDGSLGEQVFMRWDEVLGAREALKRRLDTIAAVHGWESRSARKCFLGGIEPVALVRSLRAEVASLDTAAAELERADLLLQLQHVRSSRLLLPYSYPYPYSYSYSYSYSCPHSYSYSYPPPTPTPTPTPPLPLPLLQVRRRLELQEQERDRTAEDMALLQARSIWIVVVVCVCVCVHIAACNCR